MEENNENKVEVFTSTKKPKYLKLANIFLVIFFLLSFTDENLRSGAIIRGGQLLNFIIHNYGFCGLALTVSTLLLTNVRNSSKALKAKEDIMTEALKQSETRNLEQKLDLFKTEILAAISIVSQEVIALEKSTTKGFEAVEKRFEAVEKRFEAVEKRFDKVETRLGRMETRVMTIKTEIVAELTDVITETAISIRKSVNTVAENAYKNDCYLEDDINHHRRQTDKVARAEKPRLKSLK